MEEPSATQPEPSVKPADPAAAKHPHDTHGHFISKEPQVTGLLRATTTDDDTTLVDVKVSNPLRKITQILEQIKAHQSTTVSLRFTIPLIALPIVLLAAFQLGRIQTTCSPVFSSQSGTLQVLSLQIPVKETSWYTPFLNLIPGNFVTQKTTGFTSENRAVLLTSNGDTITLLSSGAENFSPYNHAQVIVSGEYSACNKAITVDHPSNLQPLQ